MPFILDVLIDKTYVRAEQKARHLKINLIQMIKTKTL